MGELSQQNVRVGSGSDLPTGGFTYLDGEEYYQIAGYDRLPPFLLSIPSDTDIWMFISSNGGLTAGRWSPDGSLFSYETVDRLHQNHAHTGPITLIRVITQEKSERVWEPLSERSGEEFRIVRSLYRNTTGNRLVFEEVNFDLGLEFRYRWTASHDLGLVRTATLSSRASRDVRIELLDGLRNVLPYGAPLALYQSRSSLVDAYRRSDVDPDTQLGIFSLTARILDRAEAAEELRANTVWCSGLPRFEVHLDAGTVRNFRRGHSSRAESTRKGQAGSYLVSSDFVLEANTSLRWHLVADIGRSHVELAATRLRLLGGQDRDLDLEIESSLDAASANLRSNVASADGLQLTGSTETAAHHYANVLYNNMRGGVFTQNHRVPARDFAKFVSSRNRPVALRNVEFLRDLEDGVFVSGLIESAAGTGDPDLERLSYEYLPLRFGRRHGDPSRPWNRFDLQMWHADGSQVLRYEGNWRDIFQNWEALAASFPRFLPNMVAKFVNASTVDGFNPYRITRDGIEWERVDEKDPWSYIGYWGDHQIVYLLRLLEMLSRVSPGTLDTLLVRDIFAYAQVPYRIRPYPEIVRDPHSTIVFDHELDRVVQARIDELGADGALVVDEAGSVLRVVLLEKLLVPALAKISNLVPDAGIWMNTQRPEWNDANNALVGNGVSVVTLCHLRRYLQFLACLADGREGAIVPVSKEVVTWMERLRVILWKERGLVGASFWTGVDRRRFLDQVGTAFSDYREVVYARGFSGKVDVAVSSVAEFARLVLEYIDPSIRSNRREDSLYHSYNLLGLADGSGGEASIRRLSEMLEGQVAALSSGLIGPAEAVRILDALFESRMFLASQGSFLLYPERTLPSFLDRNVIPGERVRSVGLLREMLEAGDGTIVAMDAFGTFRFAPSASNAAELTGVLDSLQSEDQWRESVTRDRAAVIDLYEETFDHHSFTGRSGTMYGFEGLGCIYWHMVAKLLLAVQEVMLRAEAEAITDSGASTDAGGHVDATDRAHVPADTGSATAVAEQSRLRRTAEQSRVRRAVEFDALVDRYYRIRSGLGYEKSVAEYGAIPTDPYSHTPPHGGASQPGMTGQVKEEILARFGELGVRVKGGIVRFAPRFLRRSEFLSESGTFHHFDVHGEERMIELPRGALAFTFCQVPILYTLVREATIRVTFRSGESATVLDDRIDRTTSRLLLDRGGEISRIDVGVPERHLRTE